MIDFLLTKPYLHIFTKGEFKIDFKNGEYHFSLGLSDEEIKKLKEVLSREER